MALIVALILVLMRITAPAAADTVQATPEPPTFEALATADSATDCDQIGLLVYENKLEEEVPGHVNRICAEQGIEFVLVHCWIADDLYLGGYDITLPAGTAWVECALIASNGAGNAILVRPEHFTLVDADGTRFLPSENPVEHQRWNGELIATDSAKLFHVGYLVTEDFPEPGLLEVGNPDSIGVPAGVFLLGDILTWTDAFVEGQAED